MIYGLNVYLTGFTCREFQIIYTFLPLEFFLTWLFVPKFLLFNIIKCFSFIYLFTENWSNVQYNKLADMKPIGNI